MANAKQPPDKLTHGDYRLNMIFFNLQRNSPKSQYGGKNQNRFRKTIPFETFVSAYHPEVISILASRIMAR